MSKHPIVSLEWRTGDRSRLQGFYEELFGWKFSDGPDANHTRVDTGADGLRAALHTIEPVPALPTGLVPFVRVKELAKAEDKIRELGGQIVVSGLEGPGGRYTLFRDLDFNQLALWEPTSKKARKEAVKAARAQVKAAKRQAEAIAAQEKAEARARKKAEEKAQRKADKAREAQASAQPPADEKAQKKATKKAQKKAAKQARQQAESTPSSDGAPG